MSAGMDLAALAHRQQRDAEKLQRNVARAIENPDEVDELYNFGSGVVPLPGMRKAIAIGLPSGRQIRIHLAGHNARKLGNELLEPHPEESENGTSKDTSETPGS